MEPIMQQTPPILLYKQAKEDLKAQNGSKVLNY